MSPTLTNKKTSLINYAALAADLRARQERDGLEMKDVAAQSGVDKSKLSTLVNLKGGLSMDNLLMICDWLGKTIYEYRVEAPEWMVDRLVSGTGLGREAARELAERRARAAASQVAISQAVDRMTDEEKAAIVRGAEEALAGDARR
ncbi:MAG TPA: hypothetical protein VFX13_08345 [Gaiellales bacterium]|jgi:transcriptional regulator with XRE-family HTH domain|nr:hypothetical protein [Gaiellales bacterium]